MCQNWVKNKFYLNVLHFFLRVESPCIYVAFSMQARSTGIPDDVKCGDFTYLLPPGDGVVERVGCHRALQAENVENYETFHSLGGIN